jgi:uncharacterized protein (DUF1697 family)
VARYGAFLRGINLGRNRRIAGADLRAAFEEAGLEHVETFRTSGNVVFDGRGTAAALKSRIEKGLVDATGHEVVVFLRDEREVRAIAGERPFPPGVTEASAGKLQVLLLPAKPRPAARTEVLALATGEDRLAFGERELYWLPSGGMRDAAIDVRAIERLVGPTTMRTKGTMDQLAAKFFAA